MRLFRKVNSQVDLQAESDFIKSTFYVLLQYLHQ